MWSCPDVATVRERKGVNLFTCVKLFANATGNCPEVLNAFSRDRGIIIMNVPRRDDLPKHAESAHAPRPGHGRSCRPEFLSGHCSRSALAYDIILRKVNDELLGNPITKNPSTERNVMQ